MLGPSGREGFYGHADSSNPIHGNDTGRTGGDSRKTRGGAKRRTGCVSRLGDAVDGRGVAAVAGVGGVPDEPVLEGPGFQSNARRVVRLLPPRHHSAGILFPSWSSVAVFHRQPYGEGRALRGIILACAVALLRAGSSGRVPALDGSFHDLFYS